MTQLKITANEPYAQWKEILSSMNDREKTVIIQRFGLDNKEPKTLEQVGISLNVTRERIRQIEAKALRKMRHKAQVIGAKVDDYID